jgi:hypothetical protein
MSDSDLRFPDQERWRAMTDPLLEYRTWRRGIDWHWHVREVTKDYLQFIASGVANSRHSARVEALQDCLRYIDRQREL